MKVKDLIEQLRDCNPEAVVKAFDPEADAIVEVTGLLYSETELEICTDADIDEE